MPLRRYISHPIGSGAWSSGGPFSIELSPTPGTITGLVIYVRPSITTTTVTALNDAWDRFIATMSLTGDGKTFFAFTNMRAAYHLTRFRGHGMARPPVAAGSLTTDQSTPYEFAYYFHFGQKLREVVNGRVRANPWELSAGIPPLSKGNLTLQGTWGTTNAPGTNWSILSGTTFSVGYFMVSPTTGDADSDWLPQAMPRWEMATPTPTATSSLLQTAYNIPSGDYLQALMLMGTNGSGAPRDDGVLGSLELFNQKRGQSLWRTDRYKHSELLTQAVWGAAIGQGWPASDDNSTLVTPSVAKNADEGLVYLPGDLLSPTGHPVYGAYMGDVATGDIQLRYGVDDATGITLDVVSVKYQGVAA